MMEGPQVAVIVPTRDAARTLAACLISLRSQTVPCRVVVVDNASEDTTLEIARGLTELVLSGGPERSAQRNQGAATIDAPIIGFIDADMVAPPTLAEEVLDQIQAGAVSVVVPERSFGLGFWSKVRDFERSFYPGTDIEAVRFLTREAWSKLGGYDEAMTGGEDWDLSIRAARFGPVGRTLSVVQHDEGHLRYRDACAKKGYYASGLRRFATVHGMRSLGPMVLRPWVARPWRLLSPHPLLGLGLVVLKAGEALAIASQLSGSNYRPGGRTGRLLSGFRQDLRRPDTTQRR
jgi:glycosyltransferase involved in cell wall biosynthesis